MFWDIILDPIRNFLSDDNSYRMIAAIGIAFFITRAASMASGSIGMWQELKFGTALLIVLVGAFYLA